GEVRAAFKRAPWAFAFSFVVTLLFALPLYLLKVEMIPREAAWLPSLVFIVFIFPARLLTGWAYGRSERRGHPPPWGLRWLGRGGLGVGGRGGDAGGGLGLHVPHLLPAGPLLERHLEPVRAARLPAAGALRGDVTVCRLRLGGPLRRAHAKPQAAKGHNQPR